MPTPIRDHVHHLLERLVEEHRIVVWYDGDGGLATVFESFERPEIIKIDGRPSVLAARRELDGTWPDVVAGRRTALAYVPTPPPETDEARRQDLFWGHALAGAAFGAQIAERLPALARAAMPARAVEIDRRIAAQPGLGLEQLESLDETRDHPLLRRAAGTTDPVQLAALLVAEPATAGTWLAEPGVRHELDDVLRLAFGFADAATGAEGLSAAFAHWLLFSEFAFDVSGSLPPQLAGLDRAPVTHRECVFQTADRLRRDREWRDAYEKTAKDVERRLRLEFIADTEEPWGARDTFDVENRAALRHVAREAREGRLANARRVLAERRTSLWRDDPMRHQLWQLALRAVNLLDVESALEVVPAASPVIEQVRAYQRADGAWGLDRAQRLFELAASECSDRTFLDDLVGHVRARYRAAIELRQQVFLDAVERQGWPPAGLRQTQVFDRFVTPRLEKGVRVAYFLVDAMRFEMGRDLAKALEPLGRTDIEAAATVIPTSTPFGMAALLPGAGLDFCGRLVDGEWIPVVNGTARPDVEARREAYREHFGSRVVDLRLDRLLESTTAGLGAALGRADLVVVRSDDIDQLGESTNAPSARRFMSTILSDLVVAARRLAEAGIGNQVFVADHGHVLLPDLPAGDVVSTPPGEWPVEKRRCRLGRSTSQLPGVKVMRAATVGIREVEGIAEVAFASGFRVFSAGAVYFHEGLSLQEALVPVVVLEAAGAGRQVSATVQAHLRTRRDYVTSRVFLAQVGFQSLTEPTLEVRVVIRAAGRPVGRTADSEDRDPSTGFIRLRRGVDVSVAIELDQDFDGASFDVVLEDAANVRLDSLSLKNRTLS